MGSEYRDRRAEENGNTLTVSGTKQLLDRMNRQLGNVPGCAVKFIVCDNHAINRRCAKGRFNIQKKKKKKMGLNLSGCLLAFCVQL